MVTKNPRRLVVDADVARSCGRPSAIDDGARMCREALETIRKTGHKVVFSPQISAEWNKHQSGFAFTWRTDMMSRQQVCIVTPPDEADLFTRIKACDGPQCCFSVISKDCHLLTASLATDNTVLSNDDTVRKHLAQAAQRVSELGSLIWVNPTSPQEGAVKWIAGGAKPDKHRRIVSYRRATRRASRRTPQSP